MRKVKLKGKGAMEECPGSRGRGKIQRTAPGPK
jgi:hypothetical protein